jgi:hypothetical protein
MCHDFSRPPMNPGPSRPHAALYRRLAFIFLTRFTHRPSRLGPHDWDLTTGTSRLGPRTYPSALMAGGNKNSPRRVFPEAVASHSACDSRAELVTPTSYLLLTSSRQTDKVSHSFFLLLPISIAIPPARGKFDVFPPVHSCLVNHIFYYHCRF